MRLLCLTILILLSAIANADYVILLHGLARTENSMGELQEKLEKQGFSVQNISYESTKYDIESLATAAIGPALKACGESKAINLVTHSMGGILVRQFIRHKRYRHKSN